MASEVVQRRLSAILVADIVGYSRLVEADEAATLAAIKELHSAVIDPLIVEHRGRIVKLMGDGLIAEFASVVDAVSCAVSIQKQLATKQAEPSVASRIVLRIGINVGDLVVDGDDLLGDGINVAARLEQLCEPGGVLISGTAFDHLQGKLGLPIDFVGEQQVKNIARPVRTYRVRLSGRRQSWRLYLRRHSSKPRIMAMAAVAILAVLVSVLWWTTSTEQARSKPGIAVLPFENFSGDEATGRLARGITEDMITDLARYRGFEVIARNSVMAYEGAPIDVRKISRDLDVSYVLQGSIQRQGDRVRISAQLLDAVSGGHVWSDRWDRPISDVFAIQTELAGQVAAQLGSFSGTILTADREAAKQKRPTNLTAYDLYLLALGSQGPATKDGIENAIVLLKQSLTVDPGFARAWTSLSFCYTQMLNWTDRQVDLRRLQLEAANRAVELDPLDGNAHAALAEALAFSGDLARSETEYDSALALNPNSADILTLYSGWASTFGKPKEGVEAAERALRLNPSAPTWTYVIYRWAFFIAGKYQQALAMHERRPREAYGRSDFVEGASILAALGRADEAKHLVKEAVSNFPDLTVELYTGNASWTSEERKQVTETMKEAGFPLCASADIVRTTPDLVRLGECLN